MMRTYARRLRAHPLRGREVLAALAFASVVAVLTPGIEPSKQASRDAVLAELQGLVPLADSTIVSVSSEQFPATKEFRGLRSRADAEAVFTEMSELGGPGARLYGLCGLKSLGSKRLSSLVSSAATDERWVGLHGGGCPIFRHRIQDAVREPEFWQICERILDQGT